MAGYGGHQGKPPKPRHESPVDSAKADPRLVASFLEALRLHEQEQTAFIPGSVKYEDLGVQQIKEPLPSTIIAGTGSSGPVAIWRWTAQAGREGLLDLSVQVTPAKGVTPATTTVGPVPGLTAQLFVVSATQAQGTPTKLSANEKSVIQRPLIISNYVQPLPVPWTSTDTNRAGGNSASLFARVFIPDASEAIAVISAASLAQEIQIWGWLEGWQWLKGSLSKQQLLQLVGAGPDRSF